VLAQMRGSAELKTEVLNMREKMRAAQTITKDMFDIKHSLGGIIDVEFLVQYLVLSHAKQYPQLTGNIGNIALLRLLASLEIISADLAERVAHAYREYRHMQHTLKLQGITNNKVEASSVTQYIEPVTALWQEVFLRA
jgi:glutamate-ammonia-ligase adenylyltransferase